MADKASGTGSLAAADSAMADTMPTSMARAAARTGTAPITTATTNPATDTTATRTGTAPTTTATTPQATDIAAVRTGTAPTTITATTHRAADITAARTGTAPAAVTAATSLATRMAVANTATASMATAYGKYDNGQNWNGTNGSYGNNRHGTGSDHWQSGNSSNQGQWNGNGQYGSNENGNQGYGSSQSQFNGNYGQSGSGSHWNPHYGNQTQGYNDNGQYGSSQYGNGSSNSYGNRQANGVTATSIRVIPTADLPGGCDPGSGPSALRARWRSAPALSRSAAAQGAPMTPRRISRSIRTKFTLNLKSSLPRPLPHPLKCPEFERRHLVVIRPGLKAFRQQQIVADQHIAAQAFLALHRVADIPNLSRLAGEFRRNRRFLPGFLDQCLFRREPRRHTAGHQVIQLVRIKRFVRRTPAHPQHRSARGFDQTIDVNTHRFDAVDRQGAAIHLAEHRPPVMGPHVERLVPPAMQPAIGGAPGEIGQRLSHDTQPVMAGARPRSPRPTRRRSPG